MDADDVYQPAIGEDTFPQPHPYMHEPLLYISNLPPYVTDESLAVGFVTCGPFRPRIDRQAVDANGNHGGTIEFKNMDKAEKALATLQSRPIPGIHPPVHILLSPYPPTNPPTALPPPSAQPRLVKHLPPQYTDSQLYDLFRPFGSIASVRTHTHFGPETGVVEFFNEDEARRAEEAIHCSEVEGMNVAVQVYQHRRVVSGPNHDAPTFIPNAAIYSQPTYSPPVQAYASLSPQLTGTTFAHGPGQQVQLAPLTGPGSTSHSGLIDPCNLFCKNLDPDIDSNSLFAHFRPYGQIVSARVMRNENGESRGFGFVSYQTPDQANAAMHEMNNKLLGSKQIVVRLHEPKQLRQEKLAARYSSGSSSSPHGGSPRSNPHSPRLGGYNGLHGGYHPRNSSGATSPTISEGDGWGSPRGSMNMVGLVGIQDRGRRGSGSYYNAAVSNSLHLPLNFQTLSTLSPVVRNDVLTGTLVRKIKGLDVIPSEEVDAVVERIVNGGIPLNDMVELLQDDQENDTLRYTVEDISRELGLGLHLQAPTSTQPSSKSQSRSASAASQDSRLLAAATASAPEHPSTPVSITASLNTPPRTSSPSGSVAPASERDKMYYAIVKLEGKHQKERNEALTDLVMSLPKKDRAMCLFNPEVLRIKLAEAREVLDSVDDDEPAPPPVAPIASRTKIAATPDLLSNGAAKAAPAPAPVAAPAAPAHTLVSLAQLPSREVMRLLNDTSSGPALRASLKLPTPDAYVVKATDDFMTDLETREPSEIQQKQQVGTKLFKALKAVGVKQAPKLTVVMLDQEDLRALSHLMASYPTILKEKANIAAAAR